MGALVDEDGVGRRSTENGEPDGIVASNPVVYQLVRVDGDGRLIPATDDELIEVKHFVEEDGTRQSENEVDTKKVMFKMDVDGPSFGQPNISDTLAKNQSTEACSEIRKNAVNEAAEGSFSKKFSSLKPDFSLLEGEICLDNFSIRELQEAFRATFGRYTSVKDKLWLKRRIAMGLTNSCNIPSANFIIKDNKIVLCNVQEETTSRTQRNMSYPGYIMMNNSTDPLNETLQRTLNDTSSGIVEQKASFTKALDKSLEKCNVENLNTQMEQCGAKRIRRPTKRYIEEHTEVEVMAYSGRVASLGKTAMHDQHCLKSKVRTPCLVDTSQDLLGGYDARIPSVLRVRRRPPRKNFLTLVNFVHTEREKMNPEVLNSEQSPHQKHEKFISSVGAAFHEKSDTVHPVEASVKRKHHRAWTLGEVLKLVEGVSRYGAGRWSQIRQVAFASGSHRTSVDLKDKWRNLLKASFAQVPTDKGIGNSRKPASLPIPTPILLRVRELADKRSDSEIEFGSSQFVGHGGIVQEKETGFL
ncbi:uncharacterized protein LOC110110710 isoform X2 [Dendrobium catenatum]|uniref:Telomere repeat-binding protein 6 n=1 Tax=Dendrobium catenatum TaxID=906689 RepID=A0A2I0VYX5_9ASPA|nr:uncharacterized protein LOC110110710 isoform X2 [Dendrobium catenatum]PKU68615.1 Telomere repeat-binding protein 6 [Dendrobium catenatum]